MSQKPAVAGLLVALIVPAVVMAGLLVWLWSTTPRAAPETTLAQPRENVPTLLAAGDIVRCDSEDDEAVAALLDGLEGTVATLGDNVYPSGTIEQFNECYGPSWGRHLARTRPAAGNHDYREGNSEGYHTYFGPAAGDPTKGYYSYPVGDHWQAIVLNSNCKHVEGGCREDSPQARWLQGELATHADRNIVAYWHHAAFSSGYHGNSNRVRDFWKILHDAGADLVLVSHDHNYERFAPLDADGELDPDGLRQFVVGTGGGELRPFPGDPAPATEVRNANTHGVLRVELHPSSYRWEFVAAGISAFKDVGEQSVR